MRSANGAGFVSDSAPFTVSNGDTQQLAAAYLGGATPGTGSISVVNNSDSNIVIGRCGDDVRSS